jgi:hypothetical protein
LAEKLTKKGRKMENLQVSNDVLIPQIKGHDGDDVRFVLDHHLSMIFYSASLLKQQ